MLGFDQTWQHRFSDFRASFFAMSALNFVEESSLSWAQIIPTFLERLAALSSLLVIFTIASSVIYRLYLHPYSKYPGPVLAKLFDFYGAYHAAIGDLHVDICRCHQKYGNIVRYGPNRIVVNSHSGLHDIYDHGKNVQKSKSYRPVAHVTGGLNLLATTDKSTFRRKRRLLSPGFSTDALKAFEPKLQQLVNHFCDLMVARDSTSKSLWTTPRNMREWCSWLTFDIIGEFAYGIELDTLRKPDHRFMLDIILDWDARNGVYVQSPSLPNHLIDAIWCPLKASDLRRGMRWRSDMKEKVTNKKLTTETLFSNLVRAKDPETGQGLPDGELMAEAQFLLVAGFESTATTLASIFFYLANNIDTRMKLAQEIRTTFSDPSEIHGGTKIQSCSYLWACIHEAMRMSPAVSGVMWREAGPRGLKVDNEVIPGGHDVGTSIYAIHHNEAYFPDSFSFIPERWILDSKEAQSEEARRAFNPFSIGPRTCIGRPLVLMEISVTMARVMYSMDFQAVSDEDGPSGRGGPGLGKGRENSGEYQLQSSLTSYSEGPMIQFRASGT